MKPANLRLISSDQHTTTAPMTLELRQHLRREAPLPLQFRSQFSPHTVFAAVADAVLGEQVSQLPVQPACRRIATIVDCLDVLTPPAPEIAQRPFACHEPLNCLQEFLAHPHASPRSV